MNKEPTASELIKQIEVALKPLPLSQPQIELIPDEKKQSYELYEVTITIRVKALLLREVQ